MHQKGPGWLIASALNHLQSIVCGHRTKRRLASYRKTGHQRNRGGGLPHSSFRGSYWLSILGPFPLLEERSCCHAHLVSLFSFHNYNFGQIKVKTSNNWGTADHQSLLFLKERMQRRAPTTNAARLIPHRRLIPECEICQPFAANMVSDLVHHCKRSPFQRLVKV